MTEKVARLTREERETIIMMADDQKSWEISSEVPRHMTRLRKVASSWGAEIAKTEYGFMVNLPAKAVRFALRPSAHRIASSTQNLTSYRASSGAKP